MRLQIEMHVAFGRLPKYIGFSILGPFCSAGNVVLCDVLLYKA